MEKEESKKLMTAVLAVMEECKNIEKNTKVGGGSYSYKGVSDKDVKLKIGESMQKNGLAIFPIKIEKTCEKNQQVSTKIIENKAVEKEVLEKSESILKKSYFTSVLVTYRLIHSSGESIEIQGYGQAVDAQDKGAGKATTYALKYALLYTFMVATGSIDDTDTTHSKEVDKEKPKEKEAFTQERLDKLIVWAKSKKEDAVIENLLKVKKDFKLSGDIEGQIDLYLNAFKKGKKSQQKK